MGFHMDQHRVTKTLNVPLDEDVFIYLEHLKIDSRAGDWPSFFKMMMDRELAYSRETGFFEKGAQDGNKKE